jgi:hypothetical protein
VRNNADLDSGGIKQTKVQVVLPLDEIYVRLQADRDRPDVDRRIMQEELDDIKKRLEREEDPKEREKQYQIWANQARTLEEALEISGPRENLDDIVQRHWQVVILGHPGSGKTTLVRYLTLRLARAILTDPERLLQPQEPWNEARIWKIPNLGPVRLPILLKISHYAEARQKDQDLALVNYLPRYFAGLSVAFADELGPLLQRMLEQGRCMVMLDGLDEIIDPTDRHLIARAIGQFAGVYRETGLPNWLAHSLAALPTRPGSESKPDAANGIDDKEIVTSWDEDVPEDIRQNLVKHLSQLRSVRRERAVRVAWDLLGEARAAHLGNRFVVTSRIAGYHFANVPGEFEHFTIRRMTLDDIKLFLEKWCPAVERRIATSPDPNQVEQRARREIDGILKAVETTPGVHRMAENPLLLRILAIIHRNEAHLPQRRVELYETASVTLLRDWHLERGTKDTAIDDTRATSLLGPLAFHIHENRASGFLSKGETQRILASILARDKGERDPENPSVETQAAVTNFLDTVREHSGLFVERGEGLYGFMHLTFEEYFTARQLVSSSSRARQLILQRLHLPRWREPILLAVGSLSKQFYVDTQELLEAILDAGSLYEATLHRDLLFAAECVGDSVNVAPVLREKIADRLFALYCDRRGKGRYRLLRQQVKDALLTLCNDRGDAAVEAALARTLTAKAGDRMAFLCALEAVEWLKARTPAVARALRGCNNTAGSARLEEALRDVETRLPDVVGQRPLAGWEVMRNNPNIQKLLGVLLSGGSREQLISSLGIPQDVANTATGELSSLSLLMEVAWAKQVIERIASVSEEQRDQEFWQSVQGIVDRSPAVSEKLQEATNMLTRAISSRADESKGVHAKLIEESTSAAEGAVTFGEALNRFEQAVHQDEENLAGIDVDQVLQRAGSDLLRAATEGHTLAPAFVAVAERVGFLPPEPDGTILARTGKKLDAETANSVLTLLYGASSGRQYTEAANYLASWVTVPFYENEEAAKVRSTVFLVVSTDLEGTDPSRRRYALQALTSETVRTLVPLGPDQIDFLLRLLDQGPDDASPALEILFALGLTVELLSTCWRILRRVGHALADAVRERLDQVTEVSGDARLLAVIDEGLSDPDLRASALELIRKVTWENTPTFVQTLAWIGTADAEVRSVAAFVLARQDDLLREVRLVLDEAALTRFGPAEVLGWPALYEDAGLGKLLGGLWSRGWSEPLRRLWFGEPAGPHSTLWLGDEMRWFLGKAKFGQRLIPVFRQAAALLEDHEQGGSETTPDPKIIDAVQTEIERNLEALATQSSTPPLLLIEAERFLQAIHGVEIGAIEAQAIEASLESIDEGDRFAALAMAAAKSDEESLAVSLFSQALQGNEQQRLRVLQCLASLQDRPKLFKALADHMADRLFGEAREISEILLLLALVARQDEPASLISRVRSALSAPYGGLSKWMAEVLSAHGLGLTAPPAAIARLLLAEEADTRVSAAVTLLAADLYAPLVTVLVDATKSDDDRIRIPGERSLYSVCRQLPTDGSTTAIEVLQNFATEVTLSRNPYLGTVSVGALSSLVHRHPYWVERWLYTKEEFLDYAGGFSQEVLSMLCDVLSDPSRPVEVRRRVGVGLFYAQIEGLEMREDPRIHRALMVVLHDPDTELRDNAATALQWAAGLGAWQVLRALLTAVEKEQETTVRETLLWSVGCVLHTLRRQDTDTSKKALLQWLANASGDYSVYGIAESLRGLAPVADARDADTVLEALLNPDRLGASEYMVRKMRSEKWKTILINSGKEWAIRRYCLETQSELLEAIAKVQSLLSSPEPKIQRIVACAMARLYHEDAERVSILSEFLHDDASVLAALLDADMDLSRWGEEGDANPSYHYRTVKQAAAWLEAKPTQEQTHFINWMLEELNQEVGGNALRTATAGVPRQRRGWPARCILAAVLAELSERMTFRAFTQTYELADVVALFAAAAADPQDFETRRYAIRLLGNLQQLTQEVADVFFAACRDVDVVYRETSKAVTRFKVFGAGSLELLTAAIQSPSITVAQQAARLLGELGISRSEDLGPDGRRRVADELIQLLDSPTAKRIVYDFGEDMNGVQAGPLYDVVYEALVRVVAGPDAPHIVSDAHGQENRATDTEGP